ncbi:MAG: Clp protease N-terminal domain-containing protein [Thermoguttaceae bacterium]
MKSELVCDPMAQEVCCLARQYAFLFAEEFVETKHMLLAATEVTPMEWHGYEQLTRKRLLDVMEGILGLSSELSDGRPCRLAPDTNEVLATAAQTAARAGRAISCRDLWTALLEREMGTPSFLIKRLGIDPKELKQRIQQAPHNTA